jgi:hypothetical protein
MRSVRILSSPLSGILVAVSLVLAVFSSLATANEMKFMLSGDKEVPPVVTKASGKGIITVNNDLTISGKVTTSGLTPSMAHIHQGKPGRQRVGGAERHQAERRRVQGLSGWRALR